MSKKKSLIIVLILVLVSLQARLWTGDSSLEQVVNLRRDINAQIVENRELEKRNARLAAEVKALRTGKDAVEARARQNMGLIKQGETFFMVIDAAPHTDAEYKTGQ